MSVKKILIVTTYFAPYRDNTFKKLADDGKYQLKFLLTVQNINHNHQEWQYDNPNKFDYTFASKGIRIKKLGVVYHEYLKLLKTYKPDVVITTVNYALVLYTKIFYRRIKVIIMSDHIKDGMSIYKWLPVRILLKKIHSVIDGVWVPGNAGQDFYVRQKRFVSESKVRQGCYTNDVESIIEKCAKYDKKAERKKFSIDEKAYIFLFVGKLIQKRDIGKILNVADIFSKKDPNVYFMIVGDGKESEKVENYLQNHDNLRYIPSLPLSELESVYAMSDSYIHLGREPYSLALYEAAILGMPIIANASVGAIYDCLKDDFNGYIYFEGEENNLIKKMEAAIRGEYNTGAAVMAAFIRLKRGVNWAFAQLKELIES